ncbi:MAG: acetyl-CoA carboxylase biotin carboxylase subunit [Acidobacteria bacterium]|nr:acetyl-CoA carboxylase biotin carboxylase subunit [Acidobacteriota bacterium]
MNKILIANRGEIAVRIVRACRDLGLKTVAVYSDCDRAALHVRFADEAVPIGENPPAHSYLRVDAVVEAALGAGADAVHPGYGFLAENPALARACRDAGLFFIGPSAEAMELMGSKTAARRAATEAGVAVVPGTKDPLGASVSDEELSAIAHTVGYPLLVKAVSGGGGKGMRAVSRPDELAGAVRSARSEAVSSFGDAAIYFERRLTRPRHIEVQLLADRYGMVVPFVERECSIQRRHQKVIEESPSVAVSPVLRRRLAAAAASVASTVGYTNAGTIEFLLDAETGEFFFLEMNTRLQVEHPITEMVTGVDLVQWQIRIARGEPLAIDRSRVLEPTGHAIECRVYAEDPDNRFLPSPGRIAALRSPAGPGIRDDSGVAEGLEVPMFYDPLISKLIAWGEDRGQAIARMARALREYQIAGIKTTLPFFRWVLDRPEFVEGRFDTTFLDRVLLERDNQSFEAREDEARRLAVMVAAIYAAQRTSSTSVWLPPSGERFGAADFRLKPEATKRLPEATKRGPEATKNWKRQARIEGLR